GGLLVFDGAQWAAIEGAPAKGRTMALRGSADQQFVFVAGAQGVRAGRVGADRKWQEAEVPDAQYAAVFGGSRSNDEFIFLTSRQQREVLVTEPRRGEWRAFPLPSRTAELTSIALDPFDARRLYVGTLGEGVFVFEGTSSKYDAPKKPEATAASL